MWTRADLKRNGKTAMKRNWLICAIAAFLVAFLGGEVFGGTMSINYKQQYEKIQQMDVEMGPGFALSEADIPYLTMGMMIFLFLFLIIMLCLFCFQILVGNVMTVGGRRFFMENREHRTEIGTVFWAFREGRYGNMVAVMFFRELFTVLWTLLFIIPGIVKSLEYMMIPYLLADNPNLDRKRAFELSRAMMDGHKWEAFVLGLSFLGWQILSGLTFGILGLVFVSPYATASFSEYYAALKAEAIHKGYTSTLELPGFRNPVPNVNRDVVTME